MENNLDIADEGSNDKELNPDEGIYVIIDESEYEYVVPMVSHRVCGSDLVVIGRRVYCDWCNRFVGNDGIERWEDTE